MEKQSKIDRSKANEMKARARHHAKQLIPLATIVHDILCNFTDQCFGQFKTTLHFRTPKGVYKIRPYGEGHNKYVGIEVILKGKRLVAMKIDEDRMKKD